MDELGDCWFFDDGGVEGLDQLDGLGLGLEQGVFQEPPHGLYLWELGHSYQYTNRNINFLCN